MTAPATPVDDTVQVWELINPSDAITFRATPEIAALIASAMLSALYFVRSVTGEDPPALPERSETELAEASFRAAYADAWASFAVVRPSRRAAYDAEMAAIDDAAARRTFRADWHARARTSTNDICAECWEFAERIRARQP